jgi:probable HAF family extracellular repeat protein
MKPLGRYLIPALLLFAPLLFSQSKIKTITPTFTTIDVPGAPLTGIGGINNSGVMVGEYGQSDYRQPLHGFEYANGVFTYFDYPGAIVTWPTGINDSGVIAGIEGDGYTIFDKGFTYDGTTFTTIQVGANTRTFIWGIDNAGDLVGGAGSANLTRGFARIGGRLQAINFPGPYVYAYATGINNHGQIVGWTTEGSPEDSYLYVNGKFKKIDVPGSTETTAFSVNDNGLVVGSYENAGTFFVFAYFKGKFISFGYPGAAVTGAYGVNNAGQVVGAYTFDYQAYHGFVTSPITSGDFE